MARILLADDDRGMLDTARRALFEQRYDGDYDHLSRYGEWQTSDAALPEAVGGNDAG